MQSTIDPGGEIVRYTVGLVMRLVSSTWSVRWLLFRFILVGVVSTAVQQLVLRQLVHLNVQPLVANVVGFEAGAQVSYVLSTYFTWRNRTVKGGHHLSLARWFTFNLTALIALFVGSVGAFFVFNSLLGINDVYASLLGTAVSSVVTFFVNNWLTFHKVGHKTLQKASDEPRVYPYDLSIVVPAYSERGRIGKTLIDLSEHLKQKQYGITEVIVVTADSPDGTTEVVAAHGHLFENFSHLNPGSRVGKGRDVAVGMLHAQGRRRIFMDADLATPLAHLDTAMSHFDQGATVVIGVRDIGTYHNSFVRNMTSRAASLVARALVVQGVVDTQCGFKMFDASLAEEVFGKMRLLQWNFDMEVLMLSRRFGHAIHGIPIHDWYDPKPKAEGLSGDSRLKAMLRGSIDPFLIRLNVWFGMYSKDNPRLLGNKTVVVHTTRTPTTTP